MSDPIALRIAENGSDSCRYVVITDPLPVRVGNHPDAEIQVCSDQDEAVDLQLERVGDRHRIVNLSTVPGKKPRAAWLRHGTTFRLGGLSVRFFARPVAPTVRLPAIESTPVADTREIDANTTSHDATAPDAPLDAAAHVARLAELEVRLNEAIGILATSGAAAV